jgi:hypothetical protein
LSQASLRGKVANVAHSVRTLPVTYPVAIDSNYRIWPSFKNQYWPARYLVDAKGRIRYHRDVQE